MFIPNATLTLKRYYLVTVRADAALGATSLQLSSSKRVTLPAGQVLTFGAVTVSLPSRTVLDGTTRQVTLANPLTTPLANGTTNLKTTGSRPEEAFLLQEIPISVEETGKQIPKDMPGVDTTAIHIEGRISSPLRYLTEEIRVQAKIPMVYRRGIKSELRGTFYVLPTLASRLGLESFFGDAISGYLQGNAT